MLLAICNSSLFELEAYERVSSILLSRGIKTLAFKQDKCLEGEFLSVSTKNNGDLCYHVTIDGEQHNVNSFDSIWYIKPSIPKEIYETYPYEEAHFIHNQFLALRNSLQFAFSSKRWLNNPIQAALMENKIHQLSLANSIGLLIPKTLITSSREEAVNFLNSNKRTIVKGLSPTTILNHVLYTNEISKIELSALDTLKLAPCIFQELIEKAFELRITVVKDKIFTVQIFSQEDEKTAVDWRSEPKLNDYEVRMTETNLPKHIEKLIIKYMNVCKLNFGCIDMIVTPDNKYIFLEINPNGQWYFAQIKTGMDIASEIANYFT